jgi:hypothetical protein
MTFRKTTLRLAAASALVATAGIAASAAFAQAAPNTAEAAKVSITRGAKAVADPTKLLPVPQDYHPKKTQWGDPDFTGMWPIDSIASIFFTRNDRYGNRFYLNQEELDAREKQRQGSLERYEAEAKQGKIGMGHWVESDARGSQTALLIDPPNGKLPAMTPWAQDLYKKGRSSWVNGQPYDWTADFDTWDRCITRGFPASMLPFRYNNGIRLKQSPGYVVIDLEMIHDSRVIPVVPKAQWAALQKKRWPANVRTWMGQSLGYWEDDNTLVIETTNIRAGNSVTGDHLGRGPSPLNMATMGVPPNNTIPTSDQAKVVERLTMTGPNAIMYEMTYSDPKVFTAPFTARLPWSRNEDYAFYEYACFEGDVQVRNYINASRTQRGLKTSQIGDPDRVGDLEPVAATKPASPAVGG